LISPKSSDNLNSEALRGLLFCFPAQTLNGTYFPLGRQPRGKRALHSGLRDKPKDALSSPAWRIGIEDPHDPDRIAAVVPIRTDGTRRIFGHRSRHLTGRFSLRSR
jgi:hypothetical protein